MNLGGLTFILAATLDTIIEQFGGVVIALIGASVALAGIQRSQARQRGPRTFELTREEALAELMDCRSECTRLRAERNAWRSIAIEHGWDRRSDPQD